MKKVRWGIVSTGYISAQFVHDLQFADNAQIAAVAARDINKAKSFADKYGIASAYEGYDALFNDPTIDVIYIGTPHTLHFEHASAALKAGKHVLCEKPITISSEECIALDKLAKDNNVVLMEAIWTYFLPAMKKAKAWVDAGHIGTIQHIKADFGYRMEYSATSRQYNADLAGGCLLDMGIYPLAIAAYFAQCDIENLHVMANFAPNGVDDDVVINGMYGNIKASLTTSFKCRLSNAAYIIGDKGYIRIPDAFRAFECSLYQVDELVEHYADERKSLGYQFEAEHMGELILNGKKESDVVPHQQSLLLQTQMERIKALFTQ